MWSETFVGYSRGNYMRTGIIQNRELLKETDNIMNIGLRLCGQTCLKLNSMLNVSD